jgi:hypothetical protein
MAETEDYGKSAIPLAHKTTHENGGSDEISVDELSGQLADDQPSAWALVSDKPSTFAPAAHKTSHQDGGSDEISVAGLSGLLGDGQTPLAHKISHQAGGSDEIDIKTLFQKARAYRANVQGIPAITWTKIEIDTDSYDPANITDLTNHRIIPTKPGYYLLLAQISLSNMEINCYIQPGLCLNDIFVSIGIRTFCTTAAYTAITQVLDAQYFDGIDDYIELWVFQNCANPKNLALSSFNNFLTVIGPF